MKINFAPLSSPCNRGMGWGWGGGGLKVSAKTNALPEREPGPEKKGEDQEDDLLKLFQKRVPKDLPRNVV